jgi:hypothetical protein
VTVERRGRIAGDNEGLRTVNAPEQSFQLCWNFKIASLARCFPFALAVAFCGGIANASFYGLSVVYANALGYDAVQIALVGIVLVAPAVIAIPVGALADRFRRMPVAM